MKQSLKEMLLRYKDKLLPLSLTAFIILADQIVKMLIVKAKPEYGLIKDIFNNGFIWIYHVRNKAIAFSLGDSLPEAIKPFVFIIVPLLVLGFLLWYYFKSSEFSKIQRWAAAGIIGGGLGNIIDRIFREDGVVDFISIRIFGLFGFERWPTFNIADSSVVISCILLFITMFIPLKKAENQKAIEKEQTTEKEQINE